MPRISEERRTEEKERQKERKRKREKETSYRCVCISICTFSQSLAPLFLLSLHMWVSLSLSLSLFVCVYECGRVLVCCPLLIPSSSLSQSLSQTYTHTVEQSKIIDVKQLLDCGQKKCSKRASWKHAHARASSHAQTRAHKKGYKLTEYTSLVCLV